jgi:hypothetical protein
MVSNWLDIFGTKNLFKKEILDKSNVIGVGVGFKETKGERTEEAAIVVFVKQKLPLAQLSENDIIPKSLNNFPTDIIEVGELKAFNKNTQRYRPVPGGVSIGHHNVTAGTFACMVYDDFTGDPLFLSNNHVLANSNNAKLGDTIIQPGSYDGGTVSSDSIGTLERFVPIRFNTSSPTCNISKTYAQFGNFVASLFNSTHRISAYKTQQEIYNLVDAAVGRPYSDDLITDTILDIGEIIGIIDAELGMKVRKSGRTTGYTSGEIIALDASVSINFGEGKTAIFEKQILTNGISAPGDSGSLLIELNNPFAVGLLFAGSDTVTIYNPIKYVLRDLHISFLPY